MTQTRIATIARLARKAAVIVRGLDDYSILNVSPSPRALKVNDKTVTDEKAKLSEADVTPEGVIKLSLGK